MTLVAPAPWSRGGRPPVITPEVKEEVCKLLAVGMSRRQAAAWFLNHRKEAPEPLSTEEKEQKHQEHLAQVRRDSEISRLKGELRDVESEKAEARRQAKEARRKADRTARREAEDEILFPRRKKRVKVPEAQGVEGSGT